MLLIVVIIIIYLYTSGMYKKVLDCISPAQSAPSDVTTSDATSSASTTSADISTLTGEAKQEALEQKLLSDGITGTNCESCEGDLSFATNDFGAPGIQFSDWAMSQTLDPRIVASNQQFVNDRLSNPQTWTGATYSPDRHDTYDAVPWQGLARPARVAINSPDQIADIDTSRYPVVSQLRWNSSETE